MILKIRVIHALARGVVTGDENLVFAWLMASNAY